MAQGRRGGRGRGGVRMPQPLMGAPAPMVPNINSEIIKNMTPATPPVSGQNVGANAGVSIARALGLLTPPAAPVAQAPAFDLAGLVGPGGDGVAQTTAYVPEDDLTTHPLDPVGMNLPMANSTENMLPVATNGPIPADKIDWEGELEDSLNQAYAYREGDTVRGVSAKLRGRVDAAKRVKEWAKTLERPPTPVETRQMVRGIYEATMGGAQPVAPTFSPEAQAALDAAFGTSPTRRIADINSLSKDQIGLAGGLLLAGLIRGKGPGQGLVALDSVIRGQQPRLDAEFQTQVANDEAKRKRGITEFGRITDLEDQATKRANDLEDFGLQQDAYEAKDERTAQRQFENSMAQLERQIQGQDAQAARATANTMLSTLPYIDSTRLNAFGAVYEQLTGKKLPEAYYNAKPTTKELIGQSTLEQNEIENTRTTKLVEGMGIKNERDRRMMENDIRRSGVNVKLAEASLKMLQAKIKAFPAQVQSEILYKQAMGQAAIQRAAAAIAQARKAPGAKAGATDADLKLLQTAQMSLDREYSNLQQQHGSLEAQIADKEVTLQRRQTMDTERSTRDTAATAAAARELEDLRKKSAPIESRMKQLEENIKITTDRIVGKLQGAGYGVPPKGSAK